ncbi:MAG: serine hydrolase [Patescibacteria group bacterium]
MFSFKEDPKYEFIAVVLLVFFVAVLSIGAVFTNSESFLQGIGVKNDFKASIYEVAKAENFQEKTADSQKEENPRAIYAKSALSVEFNKSGENILFAKNQNIKLPIASLAKLMTALVVLENYDLSWQAEISPQTMEQEGVQGVLKEGEVLSVENLLYIMLIESSNRAAFALSEILGTDKFTGLMNLKAEEIGLESTDFKDATGLNADSYSTAGDIYKLSRYLFENYPLFSKIISLEEYELYLPSGAFHHKLENTNKLLKEFKNIIGGKTGFTLRAKGCFMAIQENKERGTHSIHVILGSDNREGEMRKLISDANLQMHANYTNKKQ